MVLMTVEDLPSILTSVREFYKESGETIAGFARQVGISTTSMWFVLNYETDYQPGRRVERQLRAFVKKKRQRCPEPVNPK